MALLDDFRIDSDSCRSTLGGKFWTATSLVQRARTFTGSWDRTQLVHCLTKIVNQRPAPKQALTNTAMLHDADTVCIMSGQQPGLSLGPHFNLHKIIHSIQLAKELRLAGVKAVPVYWCASEDHDLGEANHADLIRKDGKIWRIVHQFPHIGASLHHQPARYATQAVYAALEEMQPQGLGREWLRKRLPNQDVSFSTWTANILAELFADDGLIVVEAHQLRELWRPVWQNLAERWPQQALQQQFADNQQKGYANPLGNLDTPPVFHDRPTGRVAAHADELAGADAQLLSPGAGLRPILQQYAFPCLAYCAGNGEIAYHAQLGPIYQALGVPRPALVPRKRAVVQPAWHQRACSAWHVDGPQIQESTTIDTKDNENVAEVLSELRSVIDRLQEREPNPQLQQRIKTSQQALHKEVNKLQASLLRGHRQQAQRLPLGTLQAWLRPRQTAQERVLTGLQSIWTEGPGFIDQLTNALESVAAGEEAWLSL